MVTLSTCLYNNDNLSVENYSGRMHKVVSRGRKINTMTGKKKRRQNKIIIIIIKHGVIE